MFLKAAHSKLRATYFCHIYNVAHDDCDMLNFIRKPLEIEDSVKKKKMVWTSTLMKICHLIFSISCGLTLVFYWSKHNKWIQEQRLRTSCLCWSSLKRRIIFYYRQHHIMLTKKKGSGGGVATCNMNIPKIIVQQCGFRINYFNEGSLIHITID